MKPVSLEYPLDFLLDLAEKGDTWAKRQLELNGYTDYVYGQDEGLEQEVTN